MKVFERDHGICCRCGADTEALRASAYMRISPIEPPEPWELAHGLGLESPYCSDARNYWRFRPEVEAAIDQAEYLRKEITLEWQAAKHDRQQELKAQGWPTDASRSWWEADHIKPVVEGGGQCGLENLRTLCVPCHKRATAELAARRARARQLEKQPELAMEIP
jgi:5-methylcytosine-specific restriction endonuclease McrA